ncbi:MAG: ABC transporter substrate-binding protein [Rhodospirillaceae bacterium]|nr:ABC transporter substrate-binding protein [Rhodospirillaceae bacterium]
MTGLLATAALAAALAAGAQAAERMHVKLATEGAYPPFNFIDADGKPQGFDVDIGNALCEAANLDCEWVIQDWDGMIPGLLAKKFDAVIASMSITDERKQKVDFTNKYYNTPARFVAKEGATFDFSPGGLKGKAIGVQRATIHENFLRDNFPDADIRVYATQDEANADMAAGRLDLLLADSVALDEGFLKTDQGKGFAFVGPAYTDKKWFGEGAGIAVRKGEDTLRETLNAAIKKIRQDGTYQKIQEKYFTYDVYGAESM